MTVKRLKEFSTLQRKLLKLMYEQVKNKYKDGQWHTFKSKFKIKEQYYQLECEFMLDGLFLTIGQNTIRDPNEGVIIVPNRNIIQ